MLVDAKDFFEGFGVAQEDAILDLKGMFDRKGVDAAAGEAGLQHLLVDAKDFFEGFGGVQDKGVKDAKVEKSVVPCEVAEEKEDGEPDESDEEFSFIVSLSKRGKVGTLHRRGGCWRAVRFAFGSYEVWSDPPAEHLFTRRCKDCWHQRVEVDIASQEEAEEAGSSSSSSSSCSSVVEVSADAV